MENEEMLPNIRAHSIMVARLAHLLFIELSKSPLKDPLLPNEQLILAGALLHDIAKTPCLVKGCHHAKKGRDFCEENGFPEVGEVVREHVWLFDFSPERYASGHFFAKEIVYYADKRVRHDSIVSLKARKEYILERYGNNDPERHRLIKENFDNCEQLETFLFSTLRVEKNDMQELVASHQLPGLQDSLNL
jgi:putative nucleotidyltransferase with HDIG domain